MRRMLLLSVICLAAIPSRVPGEENWPALHGPRHNSSSDATGLPLQWSESKNIVWKTPIHDSGWSSPVIWGDQVWLTTATDDGKQSFALCVHRQSGKVIHDLKVFETAEPQDTRQYNTFASPTPVIEAGRVYVSFGSYGTACLDTRSGEVLWKRSDLPCLHWRGPASSPILFGDLLLLHFDDYDFQYVAALDKRTGATVWKKDRDIDYGTTNGDLKKAYATPLVIEVNGRKQLISQAAKATFAFDPQTGEELWRFVHGGHSTAARALFGQGLVYLLSGTEKKLFAVKPEGRGDITATHVAWDYSKSMPRHPSPLLIGEMLYVIDDGGVLTCLEAATGKMAFAERIGGDFWSSLLHADGRIYCLSNQGKTTVVAAEPKFRILAENELDGAFRASPAVSDKSLFLRSETHLYRIGESK
ncbi:MAG: PQQ-binding-like beta-propeller repeat protein [Planctomycetales bacterium]